MTVTDVQKDLEGKTLTITAAFPASPAQGWQLWADPRLLERWWGPPGYPATVTDHELAPGGRVAYFMTGPEGQQYHGWWRVLSVDEPHGLEFEDGFADADGEPQPSLPTTVNRVAIAADGEGVTRMTVSSHFATVEAMEQLIQMGAVDGMTAAMNQIDQILASEPAA